MPPLVSSGIINGFGQLISIIFTLLLGILLGGGDKGKTAALIVDIIMTVVLLIGSCLQFLVKVDLKRQKDCQLEI